MWAGIVSATPPPSMQSLRCLFDADSLMRSLMRVFFSISPTMEA
jgi:hypothetical protein